MADKKINIILDTRATGDGITKTEAGMQRVDKAVKEANKGANNFTQSVKVLGGAFGQLGGAFGGLVQNILKGSIWGAAAAGVRLLVGWFGKWKDSAKEAAEESAKAAEEAAEKQRKAVDEYAAAVEKLAKSSVDASNANLKRINAELDATQKLTKATLELARERARASGDTKGTAQAESTIAMLDADTEDQRRNARLANFREQESALIEQRRGNAIVLGQRERALAAARRSLRQRVTAIRTEAERTAQGTSTISTNGMGIPSVTYTPATDAQRAAAGVAAIEAFERSDEYKKLTEAVASAKKAVSESEDQSKRLNTQIDALKAERENFKREIAAKDIATEAEALQAQNDAAKKVADERQKAEIAAAQAAAKERERLDREAHQKRMADLRAEIDVQNKAKSTQSAIAAAAQSEFERAFAMYRDPERAAQEIGEEKARAEDLDRLHKDARRYGGQWRIDELSALMSAGDTQGVQSRLQEWRKNGRFDASTEALVRASAAEKTRTTAEDELRKISANTAGLAAKLDELLAMKE